MLVFDNFSMYVIIYWVTMEIIESEYIRVHNFQIE